MSVQYCDKKHPVINKIDLFFKCLVISVKTDSNYHDSANNFTQPT